MAESLKKSIMQTTHGQQMMAALSQAGQAVLRAEKTDDVFQMVGEEVSKLGYQALIFLAKEDGTQLELIHHTFNSKIMQAAEDVSGMKSKGYTFTIPTQGYHANVLEGRMPIFYEKLSTPMAEAIPSSANPMVDKMVELLEVKQAIYSPLILNDYAAGILVVAGEKIDQTDIPAISTFANQIAIAIENVQASESLRQSVQELTALSAMTSIVNQSLDEQEILNRSLDEAIQLFEVETCTIFMMDDEKQELKLAAQRGMPEDGVRAAQRIPLGEGLSGKVAQTGMPMVVGELENYSGPHKKILVRDNRHSLAALPLTQQDRVIGVMTLTSIQPDFFKETRLELLSALGKQIATGIEKARLFRQTRSWAEELELSSCRTVCSIGDQ